MSYISNKSEGITLEQWILGGGIILSYGGPNPTSLNDWRKSTHDTEVVSEKGIVRRN